MNLLVCIGHLILYCAFIIDAPAVGASAFFTMSFDIVVAKLTNLSVNGISAEFQVLACFIWMLQARRDESVLILVAPK